MDKGSFTGTVQKICPFLLLLIVPGLNGSYVSVVPDVTMNTTLWNLKVLNANTPPRWKLTNWLCCVRQTFRVFFSKILQYIIVISSHILVLFTNSGLSSVHVAQGGASSHPKSTVHFLQRLSVIAIFWCYCFIPHNELQGAEEKRKEKMSSDIINMYPKVWPPFSAHGAGLLCFHLKYCIQYIL